MEKYALRHMTSVAAGITNPALAWIHYANALLAILGTLIFGTDRKSVV